MELVPGSISAGNSLAVGLYQRQFPGEVQLLAQKVQILLYEALLVGDPDVNRLLSTRAEFDFLFGTSDLAGSLCHLVRPFRDARFDLGKGEECGLTVGLVTEQPENEDARCIIDLYLAFMPSSILWSLSQYQ